MVNTDAQPRLLHTMLRVRDLQPSLRFYVDLLGMRVMRQEQFSEGRFTLVFVGYGDEQQDTVLELTHNWDNPDYEHGNRFGHIAIAVDDVVQVCQQLAEAGVVIQRAPAPMRFANQHGERELIAFVEDPDGYRVELIQQERARRAPHPHLL